ncbi:N-6 DNA methylase [Streptomyces acidiscabies]|uniref:N-6 DNA methylase n=1 Tax=Streptomyces acidiscabies TaxID=42234 RepID=A0ABU4MCV0_9ACTN|nr:N-6 DNA methylase [Streptomyces acidiscabies]MDX3025637.1 N-6 DNA methylase [Streptomyces acidiscabies]
MPRQPRRDHVDQADGENRMTQQGRRVLVTLADIARIAGVGRAAASNWRRRHDDFPARVPDEGSDAHPKFLLDAVEKWLTAHGKNRGQADLPERLWLRIEALGNRDRMGLVIAETGWRLAPAAQPPAWPSRLPELSAAERKLVEDTAREGAQPGGSAAYHGLLQRWLSTHTRQITTTPQPLAEFMAALADRARPGGRPVRRVLDPACGTGTLLVAAARQWPGAKALELAGVDADPVLARLAAARLALTAEGAHSATLAADTLRDVIGPPAAGGPADVVLCNPPANDRDWGHAELATDRRWEFGQPSRTEPELAWIQHMVSVLEEDGTAVVVLPAAVASRRAGRRIRAGLLRAGVVRAVIALPPGAAAPYGVGLHLWVLHAPGRSPDGGRVLLADLTHCRHTPPSGGPQTIDWDTLRETVFAALEGNTPSGTVSAPVSLLLSEETDLAPARHMPPDVPADTDLNRQWAQFDRALGALQDTRNALSPLHVTFPQQGHTTPAVSVGELENAGVVTLTPGAPVPEDLLQRHPQPAPGVRVLARGQWWMTAQDAEHGERNGELTLTRPGDVVVATAHAAYDAWAETAPSVLGPHLCRLRADTGLLDPWFLAACLRGRASARQAGTHAAVHSRVNVRRLKVLRVPLAEQQRIGAVYRQLVAFETAAAHLAAATADVTESLSTLLALGRIGTT